jgi:hypothetical protein
MGALPSEELIISKVYDPEEMLAEGLTKEGSKMYDLEESLAEGLMKEGGVRPNRRPALRRTNNE